jgi:hypothetical protein
MDVERLTDECEDARSVELAEILAARADSYGNGLRMPEMGSYLDN